jgi:AraC family transcriptional regulator of adaptative response/methylated-DNA-[protein]-cysteine methyltransferase
MQYATAHTDDLGVVLVASQNGSICCIELADSVPQAVAQLQARFPGARLSEVHASGHTFLNAVRAMIEDPVKASNLPLAVSGTTFQRQVWQALQDIPEGQTVSYAGLAQRLGKPKAVRAVAGACAANRLAVVIPCHRVVRSDGGLSGYRWGVERKRILLAREARRAGANTA